MTTKKRAHYKYGSGKHYETMEDEHGLKRPRAKKRAQFDFAAMEEAALRNKQRLVKYDAKIWDTAGVTATPRPRKKKRWAR